MGDADPGDLPDEPILPLLGEIEVVEEAEPTNTSEIQNKPEAELEDENTCKICRLGSSDDNPLYYPCKCSVRRHTSVVGLIHNCHL